MNQNSHTQPLMTAREVATLLNMPVSTLRKNVSFSPDSVPPHLKLGDAANSPVRWRLEDVNAWIEAKVQC